MRPRADAVEALVAGAGGHVRDPAGPDAPAYATTGRRGPPGRIWRAVWPKLAAATIAVGVWQAVVLAELRPRYLLPGPLPVFGRLVEGVTGDMALVSATGITLARAGAGFSIAVIVGSVVGLAVATVPLLRVAVGSLVTGIQTMPSIAWFPFAILLFDRSERAILFVVVLGAAPAIANGLLHGIDQTPELLHRAGRVLGASGIDRYRLLVLPAALPAFVGGLKQGWAFAWRSLMAGELLVVVATRHSLGARLQFARELGDAHRLLATMIVILLVGVLVDTLVFARLDAAVARRWGLVGDRA